jgi:hypothetical protein
MNSNAEQVNKQKVPSVIFSLILFHAYTLSLSSFPLTIFYPFSHQLSYMGDEIISSSPHCLLSMKMLLLLSFSPLLFCLVKKLINQVKRLSYFLDNHNRIKTYLGKSFSTPSTSLPTTTLTLSLKNITF